MTTHPKPKDLRAMVAAATPGPWWVDGPPWNRIVWNDSETRVCFMAHSNGLNDDRDIVTSELIAQAPQLALALADVLEREAAKDARIERLRNGLDEAFLAIVDARSHADPGPLFRVLNELLGRVDDIRRAALEAKP